MLLNRKSKQMKKRYITPETAIVCTQVETPLLSASNPNSSAAPQYNIGTDASSWYGNGSVQDDYGSGPGVTGAKKCTFSDFND